MNLQEMVSEQVKLETAIYRFGGTMFFFKGYRQIRDGLETFTIFNHPRQHWFFSWEIEILPYDPF